ncbi:MAG: hypothetical protein Q4B08_13300 [Propionibacteriaceae bacterium]|nr:hypothetical protein [Propionibacteriaceae bacterium]
MLRTFVLALFAVASTLAPSAFAGPAQDSAAPAAPETFLCRIMPAFPFCGRHYR